MFLGRIVADGEPLWTDDDRDWALALLAYEADLCDCGQPRSISTQAEAEDTYTASKLRCHACRTIARASERFTTAPGADSAGLLISLRKGPQ